MKYSRHDSGTKLMASSSKTGEGNGYAYIGPGSRLDLRLKSNGNKLEDYLGYHIKDSDRVCYFYTLNYMLRSSGLDPSRRITKERILLAQSCIL
jgi:hypothetical protein